MRHDRLRREIERYVAYWRPILGLEGWDLRIRYDEKENTATCAARPKYLTATLYFNLPEIRKECRSLAQREELVLHEMVHAVIWKASETQVSQITYSLLRARALSAV